jgi:hypothetical protein
MYTIREKHSKNSHSASPLVKEETIQDHAGSEGIKSVGTNAIEDLWLYSELVSERMSRLARVPIS